MNRCPQPQKFGLHRDFIEYPGNPPALMTCWSFAWPETLAESQAIDGQILDLLVSNVSKYSAASPRIIWKTASRHIQIEGGPALRHWSIATVSTRAGDLVNTLDSLRILPQCRGVAEEDIVPHRGDWVFFGESGPDRVPYWNLMPWLVIENGQVSVYGTPMVLPAPFCNTIPGRKAIIGYAGGFTWEEPTRETPFPWTRDQWTFARAMALMAAAECPDPFTHDVLVALGEKVFGHALRTVALDLLTFPLFVDLIKDGRAALRAALDN